jgi:hypothetical protein
LAREIWIEAGGFVGWSGGGGPDDGGIANNWGATDDVSTEVDGGGAGSDIVADGAEVTGFSQGQRVRAKAA